MRSSILIKCLVTAFLHINYVPSQCLASWVKMSVAKCRGSWVVGRGRGSWVWVWVNVVGKKSIEKNDKVK